MRIAIDLIGFFGALSIVVGVFLMFGLPLALITLGLLMIALALFAANKYENSNVSDSE